MTKTTSRMTERKTSFSPKYFKRAEGTDNSEPTQRKGRRKVEELKATASEKWMKVFD